MLSDFGPGNSGPSDFSDATKGLKSLLTSKAVESTCYYLLEFRDDLTPRWLEGFFEEHPLSEGGWHESLSTLMRTEPEEMIIRRLAQRPRGGSGNNPFLPPNRYQMEYTMTIEPLKLAQRIIKGRVQLAEEWRGDFKTVEMENAELLRHHDDLYTMDEDLAERSRHLVFDHDPFGNTNSPYRGRNYRELLDFVTKEALRYYRDELRIRGDRFTTNWMERFLMSNEELKGNKLLEAMLDATMIMVRDPRSSTPRVIAPVEVAKEVMSFRQRIADSCVAVLNQTEEDNQMLQRQHLENVRRLNLRASTIAQKRSIVEAAAGPDIPRRADVEKGLFDDGFST